MSTMNKSKNLNKLNIYNNTAKYVKSLLPLIKDNENIDPENFQNKIISMVLDECTGESVEASITKPVYNKAADFICLAYDLFIKGQHEKSLKHMSLAFQENDSKQLIQAMINMNNLAEDIEDYEDTDINEYRNLDDEDSDVITYNENNVFNSDNDEENFDELDYSENEDNNSSLDDTNDESEECNDNNDNNNEEYDENKLDKAIAEMMNEIDDDIDDDEIDNDNNDAYNDDELEINDNDNDDNEVTLESNIKSITSSNIPLKNEKILKNKVSLYGDNRSKIVANSLK